MRRLKLMLLGVMGVMLLTTGCRNLFSSNQSATTMRWKSYNQVEAAFLKIQPYETTEENLRKLGFDPKDSPNVKILNYVDIIAIFMPNPAIRERDLPDAVRECIYAKEKSRAFVVELQDIRNKRHGNLFLDIFGFKRLNHESGWRFKGIILLNDGMVVYKLSSGEPQVARDEKRVKPLGPLQEVDNIIAPPAVNAGY